MNRSGEPQGSNTAPSEPQTQATAPNPAYDYWTFDPSFLEVPPHHSQTTSQGRAEVSSLADFFTELGAQPMSTISWNAQLPKPTESALASLPEFIEKQMGAQRLSGQADEAVRMEFVQAAVQQQYGRFMPVEELWDKLRFFRGDWTEEHEQIYCAAVAEMRPQLPVLIAQKLESAGFPCPPEVVRNKLETLQPLNRKRDIEETGRIRPSTPSRDGSTR